MGIAYTDYGWHNNVNYYSSPHPTIYIIGLLTCYKLFKVLCRFLGNIKIEGYKDGALIDVIQSGKWDEAKVKQQLAAFGQLDQQVRYYRVKYYFDLSKVLTPEQRKLVQKDIAQTLGE